MAITLKQIAKKAGVSEATASLALNDSELVNINTKSKIKKIARELDYVADMRGKSLAKKSSDTLALVIGAMDNPFNAELSQFIKNYVKKAGFNLIICTTQGKIEEEKNYLKVLKSGAVDGAIFTTRYKNSLDIDRKIFKLYKEGLGIVYIDRINQYKPQAIVTVLSNRRTGSKELVNKFISFGHKKIAYVGNVESERFIGYKNALEENNFKLQSDYIYNTGWNDGYKVGIMAAKKILEEKKRPTGITCFNDQVAIGLIQYLQKNSVMVPGQMSVAGFDNIEISEYFSPALSTVNISKKDMAEKAVELIIKMIEAEDFSNQKKSYDFPVELVCRSSIEKISKL
ncbi:MAG: LacI family DNA-binding transcriptional regulator [bacterium]